MNFRQSSSGSISLLGSKGHAFSSFACAAFSIFSALRKTTWTREREIRFECCRSYKIYALFISSVRYASNGCKITITVTMGNGIAIYVLCFFHNLSFLSESRNTMTDRYEIRMHIKTDQITDSSQTCTIFFELNFAHFTACGLNAADTLAPFCMRQQHTLVISIEFFYKFCVTF